MTKPNDANMDVPTVVPIGGPLEEPVGCNYGCTMDDPTVVLIDDVPMDLAVVVQMVLPAVVARL